MRFLSSAAIVIALAGATGCAELTRPDAIMIIAEAPAPVKAPTPPAAAAKAKDVADSADQSAPARKPAAKAGG